MGGPRADGLILALAAAVAACDDPSSAAEPDAGSAEALWDAGPGPDAGPVVDHAFGESGLWHDGGEYVARGGVARDAFDGEPSLLFIAGGEVFRHRAGREPVTVLDGAARSLIGHALVSPERDRVALIDGNGSIAIVPIAEGEAIVLEDAASSGTRLAWSGDGSRLGYHTDEGVFAVLADGSGRQVLAGAGARHVRLDHDGERALWERPGPGGTALHVAYLGDGDGEAKVVELARVGGWPCSGAAARWHPTRPLLVYSRCRASGDMGTLRVFDAAGGEHTDVAVGVPLGDARGFHAVWDPLGEYLVFLREGRVVRVGADGSDPRTLGAVYRSTNQLAFGPAGDFVALALPRGEVTRLLALEGSRVVDVEAPEHDLYYQRHEPFVWSPDGQRIAYRAPSGWHVAAADGREVQPLEHDGEIVRLSSLGWATDELVLAESAPFHLGDGVLAGDRGSAGSMVLPGAGLSGRGERYRAFCTERLLDIEVVSMEKGEAWTTPGVGTQQLVLHYFGAGGEARTRMLDSGPFGSTGVLPRCFIP